MEWHHVIEQSQMKRSDFTAEQIHNIDDMIAIDKNIHAKVSGYFSPKQPGTNGLIVRDWLAGKDYDTQYSYGISILGKVLEENK